VPNIILKGSQNGNEQTLKETFLAKVIILIVTFKACAIKMGELHNKEII
jgi:hypothetical protein